MKRSIKWMTNRPLAHKGLHDTLTPENTLGAFRKAISNNYGVEIDLQMTKDGTIVVFHDYDLKHLLGIEGNILEVNYEYIKDAKVLNSQESVPTFEAFLKLIDGQIPVLIEVKDHKNIGIMEQKILDCLGDYKGEFALQSFNTDIVRWFIDNAPQYTTGQLAEEISEDDVVFWNKLDNGPEFLSHDLRDIKRQRVLDFKKKMPIIMWTAKSQEDVDNCQEYYDNFMFEDFIPR